MSYNDRGKISMTTTCLQMTQYYMARVTFESIVATAQLEKGKRKEMR